MYADIMPVKANRIDITILNKINKKDIVIKLSCLWLENRESKDIEDHKVQFAAIRAHKQTSWIYDHLIQHNYGCPQRFLKRGGAEY